MCYHLRSLKRKAFPCLTKLWVETTDLCNSKCKTCNIWQNKATHNILDINVLSDPLFKNVDYIINSGGEPSLVDLERLLLCEHELLPKAILQVSTNGILADKVAHAVWSALANGAKVEVGVSLDGIDDAHDEWRGVKGNFAQVDNLLEKLSCLRKEYPCLYVSVGSTLTDYTAKQCGDLLGYTRKIGVPFMWHWYNTSSFYNNCPLNVAPKVVREALGCMSDSVYKRMWLDSLYGVSPRFKCYALRNFAVLKCNGDVVPCLTLWNSAIGNVAKDKPSKVWNSENACAVRKQIAHCAGCLNSWGVGWSLQAEYWRNLRFAIMRRLKS